MSQWKRRKKERKRLKRKRRMLLRRPKMRIWMLQRINKIFRINLKTLLKTKNPQEQNLLPKKAVKMK